MYGNTKYSMTDKLVLHRTSQFGNRFFRWASTKSQVFEALNDEPTSVEHFRLKAGQPRGQPMHCTFY